MLKELKDTYEVQIWSFLFECLVEKDEATIWDLLEWS